METVRLANPAVAIHGRSFGSQHVDENLATAYAVAERGLFNIGLLHTSLDGREGHGVYAPCSIDDLRTRGDQYWALGHVHQQEFVAEAPWIVFPGCVQGRHIRETGAKGCVLVTVDDDTVTEVEHVPLDVLRWVLCRVDLTNVTEMPEVLELTREAIEKEQEAADSRPQAMRLRFHGATKMAERLAAYPERFEQQIRALGAEIAGENLWIERVENATVAKLELDENRDGDSAFGKLLAEILATPNNPDEIDGVKEVIADLRQKIPSEAFGDDSILNLDERPTIKRLVEEAKQMLIGRLLTGGGGQ